MKTSRLSISKAKVLFWYVIVNLPLLGYSFYAHELLTRFGYLHANTLLDNFGLWFLVAFKIIGANIILSVILSEFEIRSTCK